jgi:hypothetical protein
MLKKFRRAVLAMLFRYFKLCVQHVSFLSDIRENGVIAVKLFIGMADNLFVTFGIILGRGIDINRYIRSTIAVNRSETNGF